MTPTQPRTPERPDIVSGATRPLVESMALTLAERGMQRMTARVLALLVFTEWESLTMGDIGEALAASTGSVSMAVRSLVTAGLAERVPSVGRRDHFQLRPDAWERLFTTQNVVLADLVDLAGRGANTAESGGPAEARLGHMRDFYRFLHDELPALVERFRSVRDPS